MTLDLAPSIVHKERSPPKPADGEYLAFQLGAEAYGVDILCVQEIRFFEPPTQIAGSPPHVRGILDLRSVSVPVFDLRSCLGLEASFDEATVTIVMAPDGRQTVGLVVNSVSDVVALKAEHVRTMPALTEHGGTPYIHGLACIPQEGLQRTLLLLDVPQLMNRIQRGITETI